MSYMCGRCLARYAKRQQIFQQRSSASVTKRTITQKVLQRRIEAEWQWKAWAQEIEAGKRKSMLQTLEERGLINQIAGARDQLDNLLTWRRVGAYVGIDPTGPSLHVGHMLPLMALYWMYLHGFHTVTLIGGTTARIGDPTGRLAARERQQRATQVENITTMHMQLKKLWQRVEATGRRFGYEWEWAWHRELCNNSMWLQKTSFPELLFLMGSGLRLGPMLSRDTVKNRMEKGDGMSFSEFCYPVLQAWDWWHMYHTKGIQLQIGGADQYGNIVSGMDAVKYVIRNHPDRKYRLNNAMKNEVKTDHYRLQNPDDEDLEPLREPMGFTVPLLTTSSGEKFGKSAGNAIYLNKDMTSVFDLYGYFVGTPDAEVERLLRLLTFLPLPEVSAVMAEHTADPSKRKAQHTLATEVVTFVHGDAEAKTASEQHHKLVAQRGSIQLSELLEIVPESEPRGLANPRTPVTAINAPSMKLVLPRSLIVKQNWPRILYASGITDSASKAAQLIKAGGAYVGSRPGATYNRQGGLAGPLDRGDLTWTPIGNAPSNAQELVLDGDDKGDLLLLRHGKWKVKLVRIVDDDRYEQLQAENKWDDPPGWAEMKQQKLNFRKVL